MGKVGESNYFAQRVHGELKDLEPTETRQRPVGQLGDVVASEIEILEVGQLAERPAVQCLKQQRHRHDYCVLEQS